jgi:ketosteroid isomerase-like protein
MSEENVERVREGFAQLERGEGIDVELLHPDIELINFDTFPLRRPYRGLEGVGQWLADMSEPFDDFRFELVDVLGHQDEHVVTLLRAAGKSRAGGPPFELVWAAIYTFDRGRVVRIEGRRTPEEALEAVGLSA